MEIPGICLPPELAAFVDSQVDCGAFANESEVVHAALWLLREREQLRAIRLEELRSEIQVGLDQLARGEGQPLDMVEIRNEYRRQLAEQGNST